MNYPLWIEVPRLLAFSVLLVGLPWVLAFPVGELLPVDFLRSWGKPGSAVGLLLALAPGLLIAWAFGYGTRRDVAARLLQLLSHPK